MPREHYWFPDCKLEVINLVSEKKKSDSKLCKCNREAVTWNQDFKNIIVLLLYFQTKSKGKPYEYIVVIWPNRYNFKAWVLILWPMFLYYKSIWQSYNRYGNRSFYLNGSKFHCTWKSHFAWVLFTRANFKNFLNNSIIKLHL